MKEFDGLTLSGERALFDAHDAKISNCLFYDGESPLKESSNLDISFSTFDWKYPLWYCKNVVVKDSKVTCNGRAGIWYSENVRFENTRIDGAKNFRRCTNLTIVNCDFTCALETLWHCKQVKVINAKINGDYSFLNCEDVYCENVELNGNYGFDGCRKVEIHNCVLRTKDAFWNCDEVIVYDSTIVGEYLAWNTNNITFINCDIDSLQGLCYVKNLKLRNCRLHSTNLAFEYSEADAEIEGSIVSIKNPLSGTITCDGVNELIMDDEKIDPSKTKITIRGE